MKRKALLTVPFAILAVAALAPTPIAWGHTGTASGTCSGGVQWTFQNYDKTVTNAITVTIDGTVRHTDPDFKASDTGTIATDKTAAHTWTVVVNAPGSQYDRSFGGSYEACVVVPTTTVAPTTTTTVPVTTTTVTSTTVTATTEPSTTTSVVAVDEPPVPSTVAALSVVAPEPALTPEPALPTTGGLSTTLIVIAIGFMILGVYLVMRGRREG